nr:sigma-54 dependent transcriptional regulator [uncultured Ralstonia sp.]
MADSRAPNLAEPLPNHGLIGQAPRFRLAVNLIRQYAAWDAPVLIEGETGTGKELAARGIHYCGGRRAHRFIPVNCGAIPENLIENELFGHVRGAFTDASVTGPGLVRLAHQGTLFLDEVDALPPRGQVALLRFLQDGCYRPLGARQEETADVRIVVASNRKLQGLVEERCFRADLMFRLHVLTLEMPPLRERPGDPLLLAEHFLHQFALRYGIAMPRTLDTCTRDWLDEYAWPGNVRELENLIHREFLLCGTGELRIPMPGCCSASNSTNLARAPLSSGMPTYALARKQALEAFDAAYLRDLLHHTGGNVTHAARLAGKERRALGKLLKLRQIDCTQYRNR